MCFTCTFNPGAVIGLYLVPELYVGEMRAVIGLIDFYGVMSIYSTSDSFFVLNDCFEKPTK